MNLVYSQNGKKGLIRTDESELTCDNLSQMIEILKIAVPWPFGTKWNKLAQDLFLEFCERITA